MASPAQTPAGHVRQNSSARRQAPKRMSTSGPLDGDDPLSSSVQPTRSPSARPHDPRPHSRQPSRSPAPPAVVDRPQRNFGFLLRPENFHQLNEADIPAAFQTDALAPAVTDELDSLIASGRFRAAALLAADQLKSLTDPFNHDTIFPLLFARLACLQILGFHFEAAQEAKCLGDLNSAFYRDPESGKHTVPWELRVLAVRLQALAFGDWRRGVVGYYELARETRYFARQTSGSDRSQWKSRLVELGLRVGMALVEMGDLTGAVRHLRTLNVKRATDLKVRAQIAMILLRLGDVPAARAALEASAAHQDPAETSAPMLLDALCKMADTDYDGAVAVWERLQSSADQVPGLKTLVIQNLAVCNLYSGRIVEARQLLQHLIDDNDASHGVLFNLSTIWELTSDKAQDMKLELSRKAAAHEPSPMGWERANADFKL